MYNVLTRKCLETEALRWAYSVCADTLWKLNISMHYRACAKKSLETLYLDAIPGVCKKPSLDTLYLDAIPGVCKKPSLDTLYLDAIPGVC